MSSVEARPSKKSRRRILEPGAGSPSGAPLTSPIKRKRSTTSTVREQELIINIYKYVRTTWPKELYLSNEKIIEKTSEISGVSKRTIYRILGEYRNSHTLVEKGTTKRHRKTILEKMDDFEKSGIRRKVHQLFLAGELPNLNKILRLVNEDAELPNLSKSTLGRVLKHLKFKYIRRNRKSTLIDRPEIVIWRTRYLAEIEKFRNAGQRIFYLDETWVNAGHTVQKVWEDSTVKTARQAFLEGLSTGAKNPTGKGKRLILVHIGNEEGFLKNCEWVFESSTTGDYHESMDAHHFEEWFKKVIGNLQSGDVIVMDNASYHSRRLEKIPRMSWRKQDIQDWLNSKNIAHENSDTKASLIEKVKPVKHKYECYITDEMAKEKGITVLRLPPYHCELNPIELVWADVKGYVARNNTTFKLVDVKKLLTEGLAEVTQEKWKKCVQHIRTIENEMRGMDTIIDQTVDRFIISVTESDTSTESEYSEDSSGDDTE